MAKHTVQVVAEVTARPDEVFHYWNERSGYPRFVPGLDAVETLDEVWSRWSLHDDVAADEATFDVEVTDVVPRHYISWRCHRRTRDRTSVRLWPCGPGASRVEVEVSWHAQDDRERERWRTWGRQLLEGFAAMMRAEHSGYVETLVSDQQFPHTD
jgi:uncharacterized membrane protein